MLNLKTFIDDVNSLTAEEMNLLVRQVEDIITIAGDRRPNDANHQLSGAIDDLTKKNLYHNISGNGNNIQLERIGTGSTTEVPRDGDFILFMSNVANTTNVKIKIHSDGTLYQVTLNGSNVSDANVIKSGIIYGARFISNKYELFYLGTNVDPSNINGDLGALSDRIDGNVTDISNLQSADTALGNRISGNDTDISNLQSADIALGNRISGNDTITSGLVKNIGAIHPYLVTNIVDDPIAGVDKDLELQLVEGTPGSVTLITNNTYHLKLTTTLDGPHIRVKIGTTGALKYIRYKNSINIPDGMLTDNKLLGLTYNGNDFDLSIIGNSTDLDSSLAGINNKISDLALIKEDTYYENVGTNAEFNLQLPGGTLYAVPLVNKKIYKFKIYETLHLNNIKAKIGNDGVVLNIRYLGSIIIPDSTIRTDNIYGLMYNGSDFDLVFISEKSDIYMKTLNLGISLDNLIDTVTQNNITNTAMILQNAQDIEGLQS